MTEKQVNKWLVEDSTAGLPLWQAWNDAANSGQKAIETPQGVQFLIVHEGWVMKSLKGEFGWEVAILRVNDFMKHWALATQFFSPEIKTWKLVTPRVLE